jgi:23S rRNA (guanosine2251-2'-O)-methyltransferase
LHVAGRRAVLEALRSGRTINRLYIDQATPAAAFAAIFEAANRRGLHAEAVPRQRLAALAGEHHQGVVAICAPIAYVDIDDLLARVQGAALPALLLALDGVQDPQNIGSLIRTAEVAGAQGILLAERRSGAVTSAVVRAAAGAALHLPVARVKNLHQAIERLQREGLQVVVAHPVAERVVYDVDLRSPTVIVVGGEGKGVGELMRKRADAVVRLPQVGQVGSLNAAVAGAVMLYEAVRQRYAAGARP